MKATPAQQQDLLRLQEQDNRLARIAHALTRMPQDIRLSELKPQAEQLRRRLAEATGSLEDAQAEQRRLESDIALVEQRLNRDSDRLQASSSTKDIEGLEAEIESLKRRRSTLEDAELEVMERAETAEQELEVVRTEQNRLEAEMAELTASRKADVERLEAERSDAQADRMVIAQGIPQDVLALYESQRTRYGIGAAAVRGGVNLGSNLTLSPSDLAAVRSAAADDVIVDGESGAILVRDENS
jgi:predicted  nucleic acid-binding Zn-ribbon protein